MRDFLPPLTSDEKPFSQNARNGIPAINFMPQYTCFNAAAISKDTSIGSHWISLITAWLQTPEKSPSREDVSV